MSRVRAAAAAFLVAASFGLGGCAVGDVVVGVHDAPTETPTGAPISVRSAERITTRVLTLAADARVASGKHAERQRKQALTGPALKEATVKSAYREQTQQPADAVVRPTQPTVLAISRTRAWPRVILATTLDDGVQNLHVLTSASATEPFKLYATVPMEPGATVPALGPIPAGTAVVKAGDGKGLVGSPKSILAAYASALSIPPPKKADPTVSTSDAFSSALTTNAKAQRKALGKLAELKRSHKPDPGSIIAFRLADGGVLMFGQMTRTDRISTTSKAKELVLPPDLAKLVGTKKVKDHVTMVTLETLAITVPTEGKASIVGAEEQRTSVKGS